MNDFLRDATLEERLKQACACIQDAFLRRKHRIDIDGIILVKIARKNTLREICYFWQMNKFWKFWMLFLTWIFLMLVSIEPPNSESVDFYDDNYPKYVVLLSLETIIVCFYIIDLLLEIYHS